MEGKLVQILQERGISRYKLSKGTGIPQSTLADWANGNVVPSSENVAKVANYLEVSADYLMGRQEIETAPTREAEADNELSEILEAARRDPNMRILFSLAKNATPEEVKRYIKMIQLMCGDNNEGNNY